MKWQQQQVIWAIKELGRHGGYLRTLSLSNGKMTIAHFRVAGCSKDLMAFHTWLAPKLKRRSKIRTMSQKCLDILELLLQWTSLDMDRTLDFDVIGGM